jgi:hypothetical protein
VGSLLRVAAVDDATNSLEVWTFDPKAMSHPVIRAKSAGTARSPGADSMKLGTPAHVRTGISAAIMLSHRHPGQQA